MKKRIVKIVAALICLALAAGMFAGCGISEPPDPTPVPETKPGFENCTVIEIPTEPLPAKLDGLGVEWDPHFLRSSISDNKKMAKDENNWKTITERAKYLGIDKARVWCMPSWYETRNDNADPNVIDWNAKGLKFTTNDFKALLSELDVCQEAGIEVTLTLWGCETSYFLSCKDTGDWVTAPNNIEEYAENVSILLQYLLNTCNYTCITGFTPMNEPNLAWKVDGGKIDQDHYIATCKAVDQRLKNDGIRDKIHLVLSDDSTNKDDWFRKCTEELKGVADSYVYHTYLFNEETSTAEIYNFSKNRVDIMNQNDPGKPVTINEFGTNRNVGAYIQTDVDEYVRGIFYSTYAEQALSAGVTGMLHWCFYDVFYSPGEDFRMQIGLFKAADKGFETRPFYYSWGMITKYTERGSDIFKVNYSEESEAISSVALRSPSGKWTYLVTNRSETEAIKVQIVNKNGATPDLKAHIYNEANVNACKASADESILIGADPSAIEVIGTSTFIELAPNSFALITDFE